MPSMQEGAPHSRIIGDSWPDHLRGVHRLPCVRGNRRPEAEGCFQHAGTRRCRGALHHFAPGERLKKGGETNEHHLGFDRSCFCRAGTLRPDPVAEEAPGKGYRP